MILSGAGAETTVIDGDLNGQVLLVGYAGPAELRPVELRGLTLIHGKQVGGSFSGFGGAINNSGILTVTDSIVSGNSSDAYGGGIYNANTLTVVRSKIVRNSAGIGGGGLFNDSWSVQTVLTVSDSSISDNTAQAESGGGIRNDRGILTVSNSAISNNSAGRSGAGVDSYGYPSQIGRVTITNSTISGNRGYWCCGGGLANGFNSTTTLRNVTVANNRAQSLDGTRGGAGGIANTEGATLTLSNTIIAGNFAPEYAPDCYDGGRFSTITSLGYNLIQRSDNECTLSGNTAGNILNQDAKLGVLASNGGSSQTHALQAGSLAIDAGNACAATDQRGFLRPFGRSCDIGAFERLGDFSLSGIAPQEGGITGKLLTHVSGNGFVDGASVKLRRSGQADIVGAPVQVDAGGSSVATSFDLAGVPTGLWDVVVTNPDGKTETLPGAFTTADTRASEVWVEVVARNAFRPGQTVTYSIFYGNRGNADALAVPLSLSIPGTSTGLVLPDIAPPPPQAEQVRTDWTGVPVDVSVGPVGGFLNVPLLIPVIPAGFTGQIQVRFDLSPDLQHGDQVRFIVAIDPPYFNPTLDPRILDGFARGARAYAAQNLGTAIPDTLVPALKQYTTTQLQNLVESGRQALIGGVGMRSQVYSLAQLDMDLALYGTVKTVSSNASRFGDGSRVVRTWLDRTPDRLFSLLEFFGPKQAHAQAQTSPVLPCLPKGSGQVLAPGQTECKGDDKSGPPPIPPPPGCNPTDPRTLKKCGLTKDLCESLPDHRVQMSPDGQPFCVPDRKSKHCPGIPINNPLAPGNIDCGIRPIVNSVDPNDKFGTKGVGANGFFRGDGELQYAILFENKPTASAPAQVVTITDRLDPQTMDLDTFSLGVITFGDIKVPVIPGVDQYTGGVDLRPGQNLVVTIKADLDKRTGRATWTFTSIDPDTGRLTEDALAGFLPPNTVPPAGEGSVTFSIKPKAGLASGARIANQASIVFDRNEAIATPIWVNTVDIAPPTSQVSPLPVTQATPSFPVAWSGTDIGSGIASYTVFVSTNDGPYTPFQTDTTLTSATFSGQAGKTYRFYSVARDLVGNVEDAPSGFDASTTVAVPGDLNGDGIVNCADLALVKASFGKRAGQAGFDPRADVNKDGVVDIRDLSYVSRLLPAGTKCS